MSVSLPPNLPRATPRVDANPSANPSTKAAQQQTGLALDKLVEAVESQAKTAGEKKVADAFAAQVAQLKGWDAKGFAPAAAPTPEQVGVSTKLAGAPPAPELGGWEDHGASPGKDPGVVQQTNASNCGAAVAVMLGESLGTTKGQGEKATMQQLQDRFSGSDGSPTTNGTTPHELSNMLANQGAQVTDTSARFDQGMLDSALARGGKAAMMVDSAKVEGDKGGEQGAAHWVSVEGKDAQGLYSVNDPATGQSTKMTAQELEKAVNTSWDKHQGGGMMVVESAGGKSEAQAAYESGTKMAPLGNKDGIGSRVMASLGRESS